MGATRSDAVGPTLAVRLGDFGAVRRQSQHVRIARTVPPRAVRELNVDAIDDRRGHISKAGFTCACPDLVIRLVQQALR